MQLGTSSLGGRGQMATFVAFPKVFPDASWLANPGASNH